MTNKIDNIIKRLDDRYEKLMENSHSRDDLSVLEPSFPVPKEPNMDSQYMSEVIDNQIEYYRKRGVFPEELFFVPEDWLYDEVLEQLNKDDVVMDMGAGDLRLSLLMAEKVKKVYAIEINHQVVSYALDVISYDIPPNLDIIVGSMFDYEIPSDVTTIVVLVKNITRPLPRYWGTDYKLLRATPDGRSLTDKTFYRPTVMRGVENNVGEVRELQ